ncbi:hypothetical protein B0H10DRAFT_238770 [Mycena sp. CBHHK59/15]|nr:hypothetical protein B0H10DRAFT_238770 [Mycena sp. CBHHK59/15]
MFSFALEDVLARWQMGIKLTPVAPVIGPEPTSRHKKPKAKNEDLPFAPQEFRDNLKLWQTLSLGYIVEWAGSTEDAFAAGPSHPGFNGAVERAWTRHFPDIEITPAVYSLAASALRNWRSEIGKRALSYLAKLFAKREEKTGETRQQRADFVAAELKDTNFVYREPAIKIKFFWDTAIFAPATLFTNTTVFSTGSGSTVNSHATLLTNPDSHDLPFFPPYFHPPYRIRLSLNPTQRSKFSSRDLPFLVFLTWSPFLEYPVSFHLHNNATIFHGWPSSIPNHI